MVHPDLWLLPGFYGRNMKLRSPGKARFKGGQVTFSVLWLAPPDLLRQHSTLRPLKVLLQPQPLTWNPSLAAKWLMKVKASPSGVSDFLWTAACQASLSMGFSRQEFWSGLPFPSPGDLPDPKGLNLGLLHCRQILYRLSHQA